MCIIYHVYRYTLHQDSVPKVFYLNWWCNTFGTESGWTTYIYNKKVKKKFEKSWNNFLFKSIRNEYNTKYNCQTEPIFKNLIISKVKDKAELGISLYTFLFHRKKKLQLKLRDYSPEPNNRIRIDFVTSFDTW